MALLRALLLLLLLLPLGLLLLLRLLLVLPLPSRRLPRCRLACVRLALLPPRLALRLLLRLRLLPLLLRLRPLRRWLRPLPLLLLLRRLGMLVLGSRLLLLLRRPRVMWLEDLAIIWLPGFGRSVRRRRRIVLAMLVREDATLSMILMPLPTTPASVSRVWPRAPFVSSVLILALILVMGLEVAPQLLTMTCSTSTTYGGIALGLLARRNGWSIIGL